MLADSPLACIRRASSDLELSSAFGGYGQFVGRPSVVASDGVVQTIVTVELSPWPSQVHCPGESGRAGRIRTRWHDTSDLETASIPTELDFGR